MLARDIMTSQVISISPTTAVQVIADLLADYRISGVPVVDEANHLLGLVTEADLIGKRGATAADIMSSRVVTARETTPVDEVAQILTSNRYKRVPVIREDRVVGVARTADLVRLMHHRSPCRGHRP